MKIWVDADACPKVIKEILYRVARRTTITTIFVANQPLQVPHSPYIKKIVVSAGFDIADKYIVDEMEAGDLIITADIPLADAAITKGGVVLNPRGTFYTAENIKHHLAMRNLMTGLRDNGVVSSGQGKLSNKEPMAFANQLDKLLQRRN
jgi:hypothetical protein